jgi:hypothetical protein
MLLQKVRNAIEISFLKLGKLKYIENKYFYTWLGSTLNSFLNAREKLLRLL